MLFNSFEKWARGAYQPTPSPFLKDGGKNAKGRHGENLQDIGKRIDVNAFEMERFYNMKNINNVR